MQVQQLLHPRYEFKCDIILHHVSTCITNKLATMHATYVMNIFHTWCNLASSSKWLQRICIKNQSHTLCYLNWMKITDVFCVVHVGSYLCSYLFMITPHLKCTNGSDYKILVTDMLSKQYILISQSVLLYCLTPSYITCRLNYVIIVASTLSDEIVMSLTYESSYKATSVTCLKRNVHEIKQKTSPNLSYTTT